MTEIKFNWSLDAELNSNIFSVYPGTRENGAEEILLKVSDDDGSTTFGYTVEEAELVANMLSIAVVQYVEDKE